MRNWVRVSLVTLMCGCGSSSTPTTFCNNANVQTCTGIRTNTQDSITGSNQVCTASGSQVVSACPTASLVGCCELLNYDGKGSSEETCYYSGTASALQSQCENGGNPGYHWSTASFF